ncbi:hypothetical protein LWF15_33480 [Kineosporia rhizophila]|uniref:hypothetical protein n=1 Tax=Kineosporia rhizophila TaxID=84633 RepID=UPI001E584A36|nr:hypothetical protein [Kineosporia rhizophila]MCE0540417.1 hypothetical protein [Kineosporia rhizophila]
MKRVILPYSFSVLVPDETETFELGMRIGDVIHEALRQANLPGIDTIEHLSHSASQASPARPGTCRVGDHIFYAPKYLHTDQAVPDICPSHAVSEHHQQVLAEHHPLFEEVIRLTGLIPVIWHSGGGTMTIVIPLTSTESDDDWSYPCYMGLEEGRTDEGLWYGTVSFYESEDDYEDGGLGVVRGSEPRHPHDWARRIAAHHRFYRTKQQ